MSLFLAHYHYVEAVAFNAAPLASVQHDIVNDAFVVFVEKATTWEINEDIKPLLRQITQNIAKRYWEDHLRNQPEKIQQLYHYGLGSPDLFFKEEEESTFSEYLSALRFCMDKLPALSRELVEFFYVQGLAFTEIASRTGRKVKTLRKALSRLRRSIGKCILSVIKTEVHYE
ncbi:MAG: sigma factor-like helix-turn-helix DNA-binding protein [Planctomycetia bacterium]|nr:sigma factor-like helix-turn-helix DNA-binding protein [Planctomycetia bacterium]